MKYFGLLALFSLAGCAGERPDTLGLKQNSLSVCPSSPNCVSSLDSDEKHKILPLEANIEEIKKVISNEERVLIVSEQENYLYVEFTSKIMGFVDDVEFHYDPATQVSQVRSASRLGKSDLGVNRKRIEKIRAELN